MVMFMLSCLQKASSEIRISNPSV